MKETIQGLRAYYEKHEKQLEVGFFVGGFVFDAVLASEIDDPLTLLQQFLYLWAIGAYLHFEILYRMHKWRPRGFNEQLWQYRNLILHFLLGSLLNLYSLFYIKSASIMNSILFLMIMLGLVIGNELPFVKSAKVSYKFALYSICLFSFASILFPLLLGFVGWFPLFLSIVCTLTVFYLSFRLLLKHLKDRLSALRAVVIPGVSVVLGFLLFYVLGWIPPVPLSVKEQGIYHLVEKKEGQYLLHTEKPWWKFWQTGDQDFRAQPGDRVYYFAQIYSPTHFSDQVYVVWSQKNANGKWVVGDRIPLNIVGGRKDGYRGFTFKSNYQAGDWRVQVMTDAGLEISREYLTIETVAPNPDRQFAILRR